MELSGLILVVLLCGLPLVIAVFIWWWTGRFRRASAAARQANKICPHCSAQVPPEALVCPVCGKIL